MIDTEETVTYEPERLTVTVHMGRRERGVKVGDVFVQGKTVYQKVQGGWGPAVEEAIREAVETARKGSEEEG